MRINKFVARATGLSRRAVDSTIQQGRVAINGIVAGLGEQVSDGDKVTLDGQTLQAADTTLVVILNKPVGYVCSREGQGNLTIYELLPDKYRSLKSIGRLDKDSSGLLLLTNDGDLANRLTHPSYAKTKVYEVTLDRPLDDADKARLDKGVKVDNYISRFLQLLSLRGRDQWQVTMSQGRNRQIRRTFSELGYTVRALHRTNFGPYSLEDLELGDYKEI